MPSPNTRLNSLGYSFGLIRETAAITSEEQRREHIRRISTVWRLSVVSSQAFLSSSQVYCLRPKALQYKMVIPEKDAKAMNVPITPKSTMFLMFAKNFFLYILNPDANTMGGSTK